ncbi:Uncharacterized protein DAT39_004348 [Clarias magur]|uniref:Uncharacterized protein n=1 Tax=Clarias magur TaxID=1594786 RepID=A0A8J4XFV6_CLAMG|nr:Uncharacterized protein DAT39_004348 [Clarias magur]
MSKARLSTDGIYRAFIHRVCSARLHRTSTRPRLTPMSSRTNARLCQNHARNRHSGTSKTTQRSSKQARLYKRSLALEHYSRVQRSDYITASCTTAIRYDHIFQTVDRRRTEDGLFVSGSSL